MPRRAKSSRSRRQKRRNSRTVGAGKTRSVNKYTRGSKSNSRRSAPRYQSQQYQQPQYQQPQQQPQQQQQPMGYKDQTTLGQSAKSGLGLGFGMGVGNAAAGVFTSMFEG
jgi:hypothetical protein